jgi:hypothetical protein
MAFVCQLLVLGNFRLRTVDTLPVLLRGWLDGSASA